MMSSLFEVRQTAVGHGQVPGHVTDSASPADHEVLHTFHDVRTMRPRCRVDGQHPGDEIAEARGVLRPEQAASAAGEGEFSVQNPELHHAFPVAHAAAGEAGVRLASGRGNG